MNYYYRYSRATAPTSLFECIDHSNNDICMFKYMHYKKRNAEIVAEERAAVDHNTVVVDNDNDDPWLFQKMKKI